MNSERLDFTIIIPTFNRPRKLSRCLRALAGLDYPQDRFEVIVVDDGSQMPSDDVIDPFANQMHLRLIVQDNSGPAAARNAGAMQARGRFLVFTDDDCAPASSWLSALAARFHQDPNRMVGGHTINALKENPYSSASQLIIDLVYAYYNADASNARFFASGNVAMPADLMREIDGFDPGFRTSEDRDLCDRWLECGYQMVYAPDAVVYHFHSLTLRSFWNQHLAYGRGAFRFNRAHARRGAPGSTLDPRFFISVLKELPGLLRPMPRQRAWPMIPLLLLWQIANTAGFVLEGLRFALRWAPEHRV